MQIEKTKGSFITLEGADGSGKTTNIQVLKEALFEAGYISHLTREPGGSYIAEKIRHLILNEKMYPLTELLLFAAARADHVHTQILPMLNDGIVVISDRFADSSFAYQGAGRNLEEKTLQLERFVLDGFEPDYTLYFNVTLAESERRLEQRRDETNRLDEESIAFKRRVYDGYDRRFKQNPHRMVNINAMLSPEEVAAQVRQWVQDVFVPNNPF